MSEPRGDAVTAARARQHEKATGAELKHWQERAGTWPLTTCIVDPHLRCGVCDQSIVKLADDYGQSFVYAPGAVLVLTVAHIRQAHGAAGGLAALVPHVRPCYPL